MEYKSPVVCLGWPLVHVAIGSGPVGRRVARGWIAIGDIAVGGIAFGGVAVGGLSLGGLAAGVIAIAGAAAGGWSVGGLALGVFTVGGVALGVVAATGGVAIAADYALGGLAAAANANDQSAREYFLTGGFFRYTEAARPYVDWLIAGAVGVAAAAWALRRSDRRTNRAGVG